MEIVLQQSAEAKSLAEKRAELAAVRNLLAERESELAQLRSQLKAFETRYMRQVGLLYAELDEIEAQIAEREAALDGSKQARERAAEARRRAQEANEAAFGNDSDEDTEVDAANDPPADLKTLFREVARRIHPDFARDEAEGSYFTLLMARANAAYSRGDTATLQRLLDDHGEIHSSVTGESASAELLRLSRQVRHAERDIAALEFEERTLRSSETAQLRADAEAAALQDRDLLAELAQRVQRSIAEATERLHRAEAP